MNRDKAFEAYLLNLDNDSFFAVYRNYLGPVRTPYNKQDLIQELQDFLVRPATGERIASLIADTDAIVLSAVQVLGSPAEEKLYRFLSGEMEYGAFKTLLLNMKDRLLLIESGGTLAGLRINPLLMDTLKSLNIGIQRLVGGMEIPVNTGAEHTHPPWLSPDFVIALYAFLREFPDPFTKSGRLRKKVAAELDIRFATLPRSEVSYGFFSFSLSLCDTLGLVTYDEDEQSVKLRPDSWEALGELPHRWIRALLWGAALTSSVERTFEYAELLLEALNTIPRNRSYTIGEMVRLLQLSGNGLSLPIDGDTVQRLVYIGILASFEDKREPDQQRYRLNDGISSYLAADDLPGDIRIHANLEITVSPGSSFSDAWKLSTIAFLARYDTVPTYVLTEESVIAVPREDAPSPLETVEDIAKEVPQNVRFLLKRWETRSRAVRMMRGLIIIARDEEAEILRASGDFLTLAKEEVAPGVFIFNSEDSTALEKVFRKIDIGTTPVVEPAGKVDLDVPEYERFFLRYQQPALKGVSSRLEPVSEKSDNHGSADTIREELLQELSGQSLPEDARQEIALRIERGLILFPEQIRKDIIPQYGIEVRGLDYLGKIRMIEHAIANGDILEVITRSGSGSPQRILVRPREVVESSGDLMLRALQQPDDRAVKIRIRRISVLRRLSGTLINRNR